VTELSAFERLLRRDRLVTAAGLAAVAALAWAYVLSGAGLGMDAAEMTRVSLFPHTAAAPTAGMDMPAMPGMEALAAGPWSPRVWLLTIAMWAAMMVAMMTPSAAPAILLYGRVRLQAVARGERVAPNAVFAVGYLLVWVAFAIAAAVLHWELERSGLLSPAAMGSQSRWLSAGVLLAAGAYQLSPLKNACLTECRSPAQFLSRHWRPGTYGAVRLGVLHGAYCVGCCWLLMGLLFVGGVMNLAWIAALTLMVMAEKLAPGGRWVGVAAGVALLAWGGATLLL
jgi:predicted metal-binding membrane protein